MPAPPKKTDEVTVLSNADNLNNSADLRCMLLARFQNIAGVRTAPKIAPMVEWSSARKEDRCRLNSPKYAQNDIWTSRLTLYIAVILRTLNL
jgi:hypothetical protein